MIVITVCNTVLQCLFHLFPLLDRKLHGNKARFVSTLYCICQIDTYTVVTVAYI